MQQQKPQKEVSLKDCVDVILELETLHEEQAEGCLPNQNVLGLYISIGTFERSTCPQLQYCQPR